jgi:hypothetical protein
MFANPFNQATYGQKLMTVNQARQEIQQEWCCDKHDGQCYAPLDKDGKERFHYRITTSILSVWTNHLVRSLFLFL